MAQIIAPESIVSLSQDQKAKVTEYIYTRYKSLKDTTLLITQTSTALFVRTSKDSSPIIVGLSILD